MIEIDRIREGIGSDLVAEQFIKLQNACTHDEKMDCMVKFLDDPDEVSVIYHDIKGTRRIIFSLLIDLNLI